jgi:hypothetical protein
MGSLQAPYVSIALTRLRFGVSLCCWIVGLSLLTQLVIWCVVTFMEVRYQTIEAKSAPGALIVSGVESTKSAAPVSARAADQGPANADPNRVPTAQDRLMAKGSRFAQGAGTTAMIMVLPMLMLGALLSAGSATPGVERTVSAFMWAMMVAVLLLPVGEWLGLPWREGALVSYQTMTQQVDQVMPSGQRGWGTPVFYARFGLMPLACFVGITLVGLRFGYGVSAGIIREDLRLDPLLEREAANITPGSLHGGRAAVALRAASAASAKPAVAAAPAPTPSPTSSITQLSAGEAPRRLI